MTFSFKKKVNNQKNWLDPTDDVIILPDTPVQLEN